MKTKYEVREAGQVIGTRKSAHVYTHAVVGTVRRGGRWSFEGGVPVWSVQPDMVRVVISFHGDEKAAQKAAATARRRFADTKTLWWDSAADAIVVPAIPITCPMCFDAACETKSSECGR